MSESGNALNERGKVIRDPVHALIPIRSDEAYLLDLIDTPEFQRLRRIRQLGVSNITYPGAEHMLCLFRLAHELASEGNLPPATPRVVSEFFRSSGAIPHEDFLSFDEPQMIAAFYVWAENKNTDARALRLGELAAAFLHRRKFFHTTEIPGKDPMQASYEKLLSLKDQHKIEGVDYHHDNASFKGYKDFGSSVVHEGSDGDPMEDGSDGIFLADGEPFSHNTVPVEKDSRALITPALIQRGQFPLNRVFELISPDSRIAS